MARRTIGALVAIAAAASCAANVPTPPPRMLTIPSARATSPGCDEASTLRDTVAALERDGKIERLARAVRKADGLCPETSASSAPALARALAELQSDGDAHALVAQGKELLRRGDLSHARRAFDHALALLERSPAAHGAHVVAQGAAQANRVRLARWSPDGRFVVVASQSGLAHAPGFFTVIEPLTGIVVRQQSNVPTEELSALDFDASGTHLALEGETFEMWNLHDGALSHAFDGLTPIGFSATGRSFVSAHYDLRGAGILDVSDPSTGDVRQTLAGPSTKSFAIAPRGEAVAASGGGATVVWDLVSGAHASFPSTDEPNAAIFSADGALLAIRKKHGYPSGITIVDVASRRVVTQLVNTRCDDSSTVAFSPDGAHLAVGGKNAFICVWEFRVPRVAYEIDLPVVRAPGKAPPSTRFLRFTPDGQGLIGGSEPETANPSDSEMNLYRTSTGARLSSLGTRHTPVNLPDGSLLLLGSDRPTAFITPDLYVNDLPVATDAGPISPDARSIVARDNDGTNVITAPDGLPRSTLEDARDATMLAFSPRGDAIYGLVSGVVRVWNASSGAVLYKEDPPRRECILAGDARAFPIDLCEDREATEELSHAPAAK